LKTGNKRSGPIKRAEEATAGDLERKIGIVVTPGKSWFCRK
jgi:hypothetical protein